MAPDLIDLEGTWSCAGVPQLAHSTSAGVAAMALNDPIDLPLQRVPHLPPVRRCWELRDNLTPYDAAYVALAEAFEITLLTGDRGLTKAPGPRCSMELFEPPD